MQDLLIRLFLIKSFQTALVESWTKQKQKQKSSNNLSNQIQIKWAKIKLSKNIAVEKHVAKISTIAFKTSCSTFFL